MNQCVQLGDLLVGAGYAAAATASVAIVFLLVWLLPKLKWLGVAKIDIAKLKFDREEVIERLNEGGYDDDDDQTDEKEGGERIGFVATLFMIVFVLFAISLMAALIWSLQ